MAVLTASDILRIWEWGQDKSPLEQALTILAVAYPDIPLEQLMAWPIGQRDAHLLALRAATLGSQMIGQAQCPCCQEQLEFQLEVAALQQGNPNPSLVPNQGEPLRVTLAGYTVQMRLPTSQDLWAVMHHPPSAARQHLLQCCCESIHHDGQDIALTALPKAVLTELGQRLGACDPQAEIELSLSCGACGHDWSQLFDIVTFFWTELTAQAQRLLEEVHCLASSYGWREADILALSPGRRHAYLERIWR